MKRIFVLLVLLHLYCLKNSVYINVQTNIMQIIQQANANTVTLIVLLVLVLLLKLIVFLVIRDITIHYLQQVGHVSKNASLNIIRIKLHKNANIVKVLARIAKARPNAHHVNKVFIYS